MDFTYFYKKRIFPAEELQKQDKYDIFITSYNKSERVQAIIKNINSVSKHHLLLPDYHSYSTVEADCILHKINIEEEESTILSTYYKSCGLNKEKKICIDITGFFIPHLLFLIKYLQINGMTNFDVIYSEPIAYNEKERTQFSNDFHKVRQIQGYEGNHVPDTSNDILIIGSGYDDSRITDVANDKAKARKIQLFGFPSLQPDMYQENVLKAYRAESALGGESFSDPSKNIYAPANDPFVAAQLVNEFVQKENKKKSITNLYLSPISTKAHALGFALYSLWKNDIPSSIIFPFCQQHFTDTNKGIGKISLYSIELPKII